MLFTGCYRNTATVTVYYQYTLVYLQDPLGYWPGSNCHAQGSTYYCNLFFCMEQNMKYIKYSLSPSLSNSWLLPTMARYFCLKLQPPHSDTCKCWQDQALPQRTLSKPCCNQAAPQEAHLATWRTRHFCILWWWIPRFLRTQTPSSQPEKRQLKVDRIQRKDRGLNEIEGTSAPNLWGTPKSSIFIRVFHHQPSIFGVPHFRKHLRHAGTTHWTPGWLQHRCRPGRDAKGRCLSLHRGPGR